MTRYCKRCNKLHDNGLLVVSVSRPEDKRTICLCESCCTELVSEKLKTGFFRYGNLWKYANNQLKAEEV